MQSLPLLARHLLTASLVALLCACGGGGSDAPPSSGSDTASGSNPPPSGGTPGGTSGGTVEVLSGPHAGDGTFYGATGAGACSFDPSPGNLMVAAMNHTDYATSAACGEYIRATGPKGTVTVRITDECPECKPGDVDFSAEAFAKIADPVAGRVPIQWQVVAGDVQGPVQYRYKEGSTRWWTAIQVRNHRLPITKLEILPSGASAWIPVDRTDYNYFVHPTAINPGPLQVRITALGGAMLQDTLPEPQENLVVTGTAQFP